MKETAYFCPACGTSSVTSSSLSGGEASCEVCRWRGTREELVGFQFEHGFDSHEEMVTRFVNQLSTALARSSAVEVGRILHQWGFLDEKTMSEDLKIYIRMMAIASTKAVLEARQHIERARSHKVANDA